MNTCEIPVHESSVCGSAKQKFVVQKNGFDIYECGKCALQYVFPLPTADEIISYYDTENSRDYREISGLKPLESEVDADNGHYHPHGGRFRMMDRRNTARWILRKTKGGRLLEVGCSQGDFLAAASEFPQFKECWGLDLDRSALEYAGSRGLNVKHGTLENAPFDAGSFDIVVLWHVLEHVYDPKLALEAIRNLLSPGGWLVGCLPSPAHIKAKLKRGDWHYYCPPSHLWFFTKPSLRALCYESGLELVESSLFHYHAHMTFLARKPSQ